MIAIETNPEKIKYQKENGVFLKEFNGDKDDKALFELIPFLECKKKNDYYFFNYFDFNLFHYFYFSLRFIET